MTTQIDKPLMQAICKDVDAALADIGPKHGVVLQLGNGSFRADVASFKLNVESLGDAGEVVDRALSDLRVHRPDLVGKQINLRGDTYDIVGFRTRARKNKFTVARVSDGKRFVVDNRTIGQHRTDEVEESQR